MQNSCFYALLNVHVFPCLHQLYTVMICQQNMAHNYWHYLPSDQYKSYYCRACQILRVNTVCVSACVCSLSWALPQHNFAIFAVVNLLLIVLNLNWLQEWIYWICSGTLEAIRSWGCWTMVQWCHIKCSAKSSRFKIILLYYYLNCYISQQDCHYTCITADFEHFTEHQMAKLLYT